MYGHQCAVSFGGSLMGPAIPRPSGRASTSKHIFSIYLGCGSRHLYRGSISPTSSGQGLNLITHQRLDEAPPLLSHLLEVPVDVEDAVLLRQLDVGVDGQVHAGPAGAVTVGRQKEILS